MKELWKKKSVKAALAVIVILVAVGIVSISTQSAQRRKDYNGHVDAAEKYLTELDYEQAIAEYTLALEIEPNSTEILDALEETYLAYAQTYIDIEEYESAIEILERGYEQINRESLQEKIEEVMELQAQKEEEEKARLLAEEAERKRKQEEEEAEQQSLEEKSEAEDEETPVPEEEQEEPAKAAGTAAEYQAKAAEYVFEIQREYFENKYGDEPWIDAPCIDARNLKTQMEFCEYFTEIEDVFPYPGKSGVNVGAVNTSLLEETESQYRILVSDMVFSTIADSPDGDVSYFEFVIDKATRQGTIVDCYYDVVYVIVEPDYTPMLTLRGSYTDDYYGCVGRVFDFND